MSNKSKIIKYRIKYLEFENQIKGGAAEKESSYTLNDLNHFTNEDAIEYLRTKKGELLKSEPLQVSVDLTPISVSFVESDSELSSTSLKVMPITRGEKTDEIPSVIVTLSTLEDNYKQLLEFEQFYLYPNNFDDIGFDISSMRLDLRQIPNIKFKDVKMGEDLITRDKYSNIREKVYNEINQSRLYFGDDIRLINIEKLVGIHCTQTKTSSDSFNKEINIFKSKGDDYGRGVFTKTINSYPSLPDTTATYGGICKLIEIIGTNMLYFKEQINFDSFLSRLSDILSDELNVELNILIKERKLNKGFLLMECLSDILNFSCYTSPYGFCIIREPMFGLDKRIKAKINVYQIN
tara:strand:+ start:8 stop:1057 length:1050 start_codon:yes stop_codon:yes gene_type:complete